MTEQDVPPQNPAPSPAPTPPAGSMNTAEGTTQKPQYQKPDNLAGFVIFAFLFASGFFKYGRYLNIMRDPPSKTQLFMENFLGVAALSCAAIAAALYTIRRLRSRKRRPS